MTAPKLTEAQRLADMLARIVRNDARTDCTHDEWLAASNELTAEAERLLKDTDAGHAALKALKDGVK